MRIKLIHQLQPPHVSAAPLEIEFLAQLGQNRAAIQRQDICGDEVGNVRIGVVDCPQRRFDQSQIAKRAPRLIRVLDDLLPPGAGSGERIEQRFEQLGGGLRLPLAEFDGLDRVDLSSQPRFALRVENRVDERAQFQQRRSRCFFRALDDPRDRLGHFGEHGGLRAGLL